MAVASRLLRIPALESESALVHGFSTLLIGNVGLSHAPDPEPVLASRRDFARAVGADSDALTVVGAVHGATVARVDEPGGVVQGVDALVTDKRDVPLFATYADCYPIVLWDPQRRCAALVHAGWRGTAARVGPAAVRKMSDEYGSDPGTVVAGIGPGICGACYEVGAEVAAHFNGGFLKPGKGDRVFLDLAAANAAQLREVGVNEVHVLGLCTKETSFLPSHRRDPDGTRFGAIVALR